MPIGKAMKVLYFLNGPSPTSAEQRDAETYGYGTVFRNAQHVPASGALEECDAVAGNVPARYQKQFPIAKRIMQAITPDTVSDAPVTPMTAQPGDAPADGSVQPLVGAAPSTAPVPSVAAPGLFPGTPAPAPAAPVANPPGWKPNQ